MKPLNVLCSGEVNVAPLYQIEPFDLNSNWKGPLASIFPGENGKIGFQYRAMFFIPNLKITNEKTFQVEMQNRILMQISI